MNETIVIGIEGLVGAGKTSICKELLKYIDNSIVFHAGDIYRTIVYRLMQEMQNGANIDLKNINIKELFEKFNINIKIENRETVVYFKDKKVDLKEIQSEENSTLVSKISSIADNKEAYIVVKNIIDKLKEKYNVIFSGRDTMKIYNNLDYHVFIVADIDERVKRKSMQLKYTGDVTLLKKHIEERDKLQKDTGFYKIYDNTIVVDVTNCKTVETATKKVLENIKIGGNNVC